MFEYLLQLFVLFIVIFDPPASLAVFFAAAKGMSREERDKIALLAVFVAGAISYLVLVFGESLLILFNTNLDEFRVAGGIILTILGIQMALGRSLVDMSNIKDNSSRAIASIIGTPLLTGPAAISAIIVSVHDYGMPVTWLAVTLVLIANWVTFYISTRMNRFFSRTFIQVLSTIFGMITIAWGVKFIRLGLGI